MPKNVLRVGESLIFPWTSETRMEQNPNSQNKNTEGFFQKNQNYIIAGVIVVLLVIYFMTQKPQNVDEVKDDQSTEQTEDSDSSITDEKKVGETTDSEKPAEEKKKEESAAMIKPEEKNDQKMESEKKTDDSKMASDSKAQVAGTSTGNVSAAGTLMQSDNTVKGNLMVVKGNTKYYISTKRDFSAWVNKEVTLQAEGDANNFTFLGFKEGTSAANTGMSVGTDTTAKGGATDSEGLKMSDGTVSFSGTLKKSDNADKGNYMVSSKTGNVYVKTGKDYSGWENKEVSATANGSINSFSGVVLSEKK